jgi:hypothetical protein
VPTDDFTEFVHFVLAAPCNSGGAVTQKIHSSEWTEDLFGEGPMCNLCHVIIPPQWLSKLPEALLKENTLFEDADQDDVSANSRLGCQITLTKELDGMVVRIPDGPPTDVP